MENVNEHVLSRSNRNRGLILYGKVPPLVGGNQELAYVTVQSFLGPAPEVTFIVDPRYATPDFFEEHRSIDSWKDVAILTYLDGWNPRDNCPWQKTPEQTHRFKDGTVYSFGYCRTQHPDFPKHELWYIKRVPGDLLIVDKLCTRPKFMEKMGPDWDYSWNLISWAHIVCSSDVHINSRPWQLDMPNLPRNIYRFFSAASLV